jgi:sugar phosphate isomerase/epimerase
VVEMKYGIWTNFYGDLNLVDALSKISELRIKYVEYSFEHILTVERKGSEADFKSIREAADSFGITALQMHGPGLDWTETYNIVCGDEYIRRMCIERTCRWIEYCYRLNVPVLVEHPGSIPIKTLDELKKIESLNIESFKLIAKSAEDMGVKVAVENMCDPKPERLKGIRFLKYPAIYGSTIEEVKRICEATNPGVVGICLDTSHANCQGLNVADAVRECGSLLYATHISDNDGSGDQHLTPMRGNIDWKSVIHSLKTINYDGLLSLEIPGETHPSITVRDNRLRLISIIMENLLR